MAIRMKNLEQIKNKLDQYIFCSNKFNKYYKRL